MSFELLIILLRLGLLTGRLNTFEQAQVQHNVHDEHTQRQLPFWITQFVETVAHLHAKHSAALKNKIFIRLNT